MDASIIGAAAVTLATSYAFGDVFGLKHSLHRGFADAKQFYLSYTAMVVLAAVIVLIPGAPLGLITTAVQALAGLLLPSASVFLLLLCNDREVLGPWVNRPWLNWVAGLIVGTLLLLSGILMATTLFPHINVVAVAGYLALALVVLAVAAVPVLRWMARRQPAAPAPQLPARGVDRNTWRMPPLDPARAGHLVTRHPTRHDRPARLPGPRRAAAGGQSHPARPRIVNRRCACRFRRSQR